MCQQKEREPMRQKAHTLLKSRRPAAPGNQRRESRRVTHHHHPQAHAHHPRRSSRTTMVQCRRRYTAPSRLGRHQTTQSSRHRQHLTCMQADTLSPCTKPHLRRTQPLESRGKPICSALHRTATCTIIWVVRLVTWACSRRRQGRRVHTHMQRAMTTPTMSLERASATTRTLHSSCAITHIQYIIWSTWT